MIDFYAYLLLLLFFCSLFFLLPLWSFRSLSGKWLIILSFFFLPITVFCLYKKWGCYETIQIQSLIEKSSKKPPASFIATIEKALQKQPNNYRAWYFLGENWMKVREFSRAANAFDHVVKITKNDPHAVVKYVQALFLAHNKITLPMNHLLDNVLLVLPEERTALGLKGVYFFENKNYDQAIAIWEKLLTFIEDPAVKKTIESGIKKARMLKSKMD